MRRVKSALVLSIWLAALPAQAGPLEQGLLAYERADWETARRLLLPLAEEGAQARLAFLYRSGAGVPRDNAEALKWYRRSAEQGDPLGQVGLGYMAMAGLEMPIDHTEAATWFRKAADQGDALAMLSLATLCETGKGVPQDKACRRTICRRGSGTRSPPAVTPNTAVKSPTALAGPATRSRSA